MKAIITLEIQQLGGKDKKLNIDGSFLRNTYIMREIVVPEKRIIYITSKMSIPEKGNKNFTSERFVPEKRNTYITSEMLVPKKRTSYIMSDLYVPEKGTIANTNPAKNMKMIIMVTVAIKIIKGKLAMPRKQNDFWAR